MKKYFIVTLIFFLSFMMLMSGSKASFKLKNFEGNDFDLDKVIGKKIVLIQFWAHWCQSSLQLADKIKDLFSEKMNKVEIILINIDDNPSQGKAKNLAKDKKYPFTMLVDRPDKSVWKQFNPDQLLPLTVLLDLNGNIAYSHEGFIDGYEKELSDKLNTLLQSRKN